MENCARPITAAEAFEFCGTCVNGRARFSMPDQMHMHCPLASVGIPLITSGIA